VKSENQPLTFKTAADAFVSDCCARGLREPTIYKYRLLFRQLQAFAEQEGRRFLKESDLDWLRRFRASWPNQNVSACKKLDCLKAFFRFALESGWIANNPAAKLKPPKITERQTMPFTKEEVALIFAACTKYHDKINAVRLRALLLMLRYSGLRIRDVVTLSRDRISGDKLFLYAGKSGTPVWCPLPPATIAALDLIPLKGDYFFWTGTSKPKSAVGNWQRTLKRVFNLAGVPTGHAHRFRHTFAVELLQAGVPVERVAVMLGHRSVKVTEKYYSAWNRTRQEQLEADVRQTWVDAPTEMKGTQQVHEKSGYVN
jgi:site-specific recombinase XerD